MNAIDKESGKKIISLFWPEIVKEKYPKNYRKYLPCVETDIKPGSWQAKLVEKLNWGRKYYGRFPLADGQLDKAPWLRSTPKNNRLIEIINTALNYEFKKIKEAEDKGMCNVL